MSTHSLKAASEILAKSKLSHICFTFDSATGAFKIIGDSITVAAFENDADLMRTIKKKVEAANKETGVKTVVIESVSRTKLFAKPGTKEWKGAAKIREACGQVLADLGYGRNKSLFYGKGDAPPNWPVLYPWSDPEKGFRGPSKHSVEMCTEIVSCLTRCKIVEQDEFEYPEDGELVENDQNSLVLELSTDLDEEQGESSEHQKNTEVPQKKKPTIVSNTANKSEKRKRMRKPTALGFMDSFDNETETNKRTRFETESRPLSEYEQVRENNIAERKKLAEQLELFM